MKKRVSRWGGEDVGCEVSAFSSHWMTDILKGSARFQQYCDESRLYMGACIPDCPVETTWPEAEPLTDVLEEQIAFDLAL